MGDHNTQIYKKKSNEKDLHRFVSTKKDHKQSKNE
jgi:hypothetical protein